MLSIGSGVVHPCHGAGTVVDITTKRIGPLERQYYVVEMLGAAGKKQVFVPVTRADDMGLRAPGLADRLRAELCRCRERPEPGTVEKDYRKRYAITEEQLKSGSFQEVIEMVRCLASVALRRPLGLLDMKRYNAGKEMLASELAVAGDQDFEEALHEVEDHLAAMAEQPEPPEPPKDAPEAPKAD